MKKRTCISNILRSIILSVEQRRNDDPRTLGLLFHACCEEMRDLSYLESLMRILELTPGQDAPERAVLRSSDIFNLTCFYGQLCSAQPAASRPGYLASATGLRRYLDLRADPLLQGGHV